MHSTIESLFMPIKKEITTVLANPFLPSKVVELKIAIFKRKAMMVWDKKWRRVGVQ